MRPAAIQRTNKVAKQPVEAVNQMDRPIVIAIQERVEYDRMRTRVLRAEAARNNPSLNGGE